MVNSSRKHHRGEVPSSHTVSKISSALASPRGSQRLQSRESFIPTFYVSNAWKSGEANAKEIEALNLVIANAAYASWEEKQQLRPPPRLADPLEQCLGVQQLQIGV